MFEARVLGVDPGTASVGLAVLDGGPKPIVRWAETVRTAADLPASERLMLIHLRTAEAITAHDPQVMALERLLWGRNTESAMGVARATGVIMLAAAQAGVGVEEYAPLEVKMAVTGVGNSPKEAVRRALAKILGMEGVPDDPDAADAVAVGVCHLHQSRMRRLTGGGVR